MRLRRFHATAAAVALAVVGGIGAGTAFAASTGHGTAARHHHGPSTATPIRHLVVIFDENVSFDHYFGTYPFAANLPGETPFHAARNTPTVNGLYDNVVAGKPTGPLLTANPNGAVTRLGPADPMTCDQNHGYTAEQNAAGYQDGHAGYSNPADEQTWLVDTINHLESLSTWKSTAVVITWDDSDGWYDHVLAPLLTESQTSLDTLTSTGQCGSSAAAVPVNTSGQPEQGKCGLGPRLPFMVISPFAKANFVSNSLLDQSSVVKFIEYNWHLPALGDGAADTAAGSIGLMFDFHHRNPKLFLDPATGQVARRH